MIAFGVDIGGSGIKAAPVDTATGNLVAKRRRIQTPHPSNPSAVIEAVADLVSPRSWDGPIGIALPAVVTHGVVMTAANIDTGWIGFDAQAAFSEIIDRNVTVLNDADAAGIAEARTGAGAGVEGVVLLLTFGTGIGSALLNDGVLLPNTEFGHLEFEGGMAEEHAAGRLVKSGSMDIETWARRVDTLLGYLERLFSPDRIVIGGGISNRFDEFIGFISTDAEVVPARLRNNAGIVGAALAAQEDTP